MLEEAEPSVKSTNNVTTERNAFEDIGSFEELDCLSQFLTEPYPGNGKGIIGLEVEWIDDTDICEFESLSSLCCPPHQSQNRCRGR
ncbi:hypothetical protein AVEN_263468-1 [Araneus ventricosus]|uniref:Uncharacterized protein n=1 Tax=Araneus ventricosus TaxID=182803 RepID=A0A4Y2SEI7_ARAVE|nr:hypothetical protein AVEN_263468-1 [Araneus ventricosus]